MLNKITSILGIIIILIILSVSVGFAKSLVDKGISADDGTETAIPKSIREIIELVQPVYFDELGNLMLPDGQPAAFKENNFINTHKSKVSAVTVIIIHFNSAPRERYPGGPIRNAYNTWNGMNGKNREVSVNWTVDEFPLSTNPENDTSQGVGILQTQSGSGDAEFPYAGAHLSIGRADDTFEFTAGIYETLGLTGQWSDGGKFILKKNSVAFEQVGLNYSTEFPDNFPNDRQLANALSLVIAAMKQWDLTPWDVLGHHEVQQKSDPGNEYMAIMRTLIGCYAMDHRVNDPELYDLVFGSQKPRNYFTIVQEYYDEFYNARYTPSRLRENREKWMDYIEFEELLDGIEANEWKIHFDRSLFDSEEETIVGNYSFEKPLNSGKDEQEATLKTFPDPNDEPEVVDIIIEEEFYDNKPPPNPPTTDEDKLEPKPTNYTLPIIAILLVFGSSAILWHSKRLVTRR